MSEPHNLDATVFVYEHKTTGEVKAFYRESAVSFNNSEAISEWTHVATLEPGLCAGAQAGHGWIVRDLRGIFFKCHCGKGE